jgi:hypothetical protein
MIERLAIQPDISLSIASPTQSPGGSPSGTLIASPSMSMTSPSTSSSHGGGHGVMSFPATPADFDGPVQVLLRSPGACSAMEVEQSLTIRQVRERVATELNNGGAVEVVQRFGRGRLVDDDRTLAEYLLGKPDAIPLVLTPVAGDGRSLLTGAAHLPPGVTTPPGSTHVTPAQSRTVSSAVARSSPTTTTTTMHTPTGRLSGLPTERSPWAFLRWTLAGAMLNGRTIASCATVCRQWRDICGSEVVWRTATLTKFASAFALVASSGRVGGGAGLDVPLWPIAGGEWPTWRIAYREFSLSHKFCPKPQNRTPVGEPRMVLHMLPLVFHKPVLIQLWLWLLYHSLMRYFECG